MFSLATKPLSGKRTRMYLKKSEKRQPNMMRMIQMQWTEYHHLHTARSLSGWVVFSAGERKVATRWPELAVMMGTWSPVTRNIRAMCWLNTVLRNFLLTSL